MNKKILFVAFLVAVAIATEHGSPADRVVAKVDQLIHNSEVEQGEHDKIHAQNEVKCTSERKFRVHEIDTGKTALAASQAELQACTNSLEVSTRALAHTKSIIKATRLEIRTAINQRAQRSAIFQGRKKELESVVAAIEEAYDIISEFKNGKAALKFV